MKKSIIIFLLILGFLAITGCYSMPTNADYWKADVYAMNQ